MKKVLFLKSKPIILLLICLLVSKLSYAADDVAFELDGIKYSITKPENKERWGGYKYIAKVEGLTNDVTSIYIPGIINYKGKECRVIAINRLRDYKNLEEIKCSKELDFVDFHSIKNNPKLRIITFEGPTDFKDANIEGCPSIEKIEYLTGEKVRKSGYDLRYLYAQNVELSPGAIHKTDLDGCNIKNLTVESAYMVRIHPYHGAKVDTLVIDRLPSYSMLKRGSVKVVDLYMEVENLVINKGVEVLPDRFIQSNTLKSITEYGSVHVALDGCFVGMRSLKDINTTNQLVLGEINYGIGSELLKSDSELGKKYLEKASNQNIKSASYDLAMLSGDDEKTIEYLKKGKELGNEKCKELLDFYVSCKALHDKYGSIVELVKANKVDSSSYKEIEMMSSKVLAPYNNKELKYKTSGYKNLPKEINYMMTYLTASRASQMKFRDTYFMGNGLVTLLGGGLFMNEKAVDEDKNIIESGINSCDEALLSDYDQTYKNFFKPILPQLLDKYDKYRERIETDIVKLDESNRALYEKRKRQMATFKQLINSRGKSALPNTKTKSTVQLSGNDIDVPEIKSIANGSHGRAFDSDNHYTDYDYYEINDGGWTNTFIKVFHAYSEVGDMLHSKWNYYYPENNKKQYKYKTAEDAARAGWVWEKKKLVRTIGVIED